MPNTIYNREYGGQFIRSSGSPGANYIEAISPKDFVHRLKICRKEIKESIHWLLLLQSANEDLLHIVKEAQKLIDEAWELVRIFTASIITAEKNQKIVK